MGSLPRFYSPLIGLYAEATPRDKALFYTLRTSALKGLAGVFDRGFWSEDAVRAAQLTPAVWHAGLAIAAEYTSVFTPEALEYDKERRRVCAREHYGRAVQSLIAISRKKDLSHNDKETVLLCIVLLTGLCSLWEDVDGALIYIRKGFQVFREWRVEEFAFRPSTHVQLLSMRSIVLLFRRFLFHDLLMEGRDNSTTALQATSSEFQAGLFISVTDAYSELLSILISSRLEFPLEGAINSSLTKPSLYKFRAPFYSWKVKFARLLASSHGSTSETESILTLEIYSAMLEIFLGINEVSAALRQLAYDAWLPTFQRIIALAERLYQVITTKTEISPRQPLFSFSLSITDVLDYFCKCRDGGLRRRAIALLRKWPQQDDIMPPSAFAARVEQLMLWEEHYTLVDEAQRPACCQCIAHTFICGWHRVIYRSLCISEPKAGSLLLVTHFDVEEGRFGAGLVERMTISW